MKQLSRQDLQTFVPDIDHPDLNSMRNFLAGDRKIDIPVRLYKDGKQVYGSTVYMIGHTRQLYKAALQATLDGIATRKPAIEWDEVSFHSDKKFAKDDYLAHPSPLCDYIAIYRTVDFSLAMGGVMRDMEAIIDETDRTKARFMFEDNIIRRCAAIIATSIEVKPDPAFAPKRGLIQRFMPKF